MTASESGSTMVPQVRQRGVSDDPTSPRVLIQIAIYPPDAGGEVVDHYAWEAVQPQGLVDGGRNYDQDIVGFAEFPSYSQIGRYDDFASFRRDVETLSTYVHWKFEERDGEE